MPLAYGMCSLEVHACIVRARRSYQHCFLAAGLSYRNIRSYRGGQDENASCYKWPL